MMVSLIFLVVTPVIFAQTRIQDFAPNPPLGFNSFDSYRSHLCEDKACTLMDVMAEKYLGSQVTELFDRCWGACSVRNVRYNGTM